MKTVTNCKGPSTHQAPTAVSHSTTSAKRMRRACLPSWQIEILKSSSLSARTIISLLTTGVRSTNLPLCPTLRPTASSARSSRQNVSYSCFDTASATSRKWTTTESRTFRSTSCATLSSSQPKLWTGRFPRESARELYGTRRAAVRRHSRSS